MTSRLPAPIAARVESFVDDLLDRVSLSADRRREARADFITHLTADVERRLAGGASADDALAQAFARFDREATRAALEQGTPDGHAVPASRPSLTVGLLRDLRLGARTLRRAPGFAVLATLTLALGIGLASAMFSVVDAVLIRDLPWTDPGRLARVWPEKYQNEAMVAALREDTTSFSHIAGIRTGSFTLLGEGDAVVVPGALVDVDYFRLLGAVPAHGRTFTADDALAGQEDVVVLSHGLWRDTFGADPSVVGRTIELGGFGLGRRRVIGVMDATFVDFREAPRLWVPLPRDPQSPNYQGSYAMAVIARLRPEVSVAQASADVRRLVPDYATRFPTQFRPARESPVDVLPLAETLVSDVRPTLVALFGGVGFVLLIACANVANLLLARGAARQREMALRLALGAGRVRLVRQLLAESLWLGLAGGGVGLVIAAGALQLASVELGAILPRVTTLGLDARVFGFAAGVSVLASLLFGCLPAIRATTVAPRAVLVEGGRGSTAGRRRRRLHHTLVAAELALALVLVVGAALMSKSLWRLSHVDAGFVADGLVTMVLQPPPGRYTQTEDFARLYTALHDRLATLPGVDRVAGISYLPFGRGAGIPYQVEGDASTDDAGSQVVQIRLVTPSYFQTLGVPIVQGRAFTAADTSSQDQVGIVNEAFVRQHFPDGRAEGRRILTTGGALICTIVGVVRDVRQQGLSQPPQPELYRVTGQSGWFIPNVVARVSGDEAAALDLMRQAARAVDPDVPIVEAGPMTAVMSESLGEDRFFTALFALFGALASVLGAVGVYGVMSYAVGQRRSEIGVRMALGSTRGEVVRLVLRQAMVPVAAGLVAGLLLALAMTRWLESALFEVSTTDPVVFSAVALGLLAVGAAASWIPARRAARVDPLRALGE